MTAGSQQNSSFQKLLEYEKRSLEQAVDATAEQERAANNSCVVFRMGGFNLALGIDSINEILEVPPYNLVPGAKPWILGLANLRGNLITVIDLFWFLTGVRSPINARSRLIVTPLGGQPVGLLVDDVFGQRHFHTDDAAKTKVFHKTVMQDFVAEQYTPPGEAWGFFELPQLYAKTEFLNGAA